MLILTGLSIFLSAALLFLVQPMIGKVLLPTLGGSPAVWNTCMVFFQATLLLGYGYSHLLSTRTKPAIQAIIHAAVLGAAAWALPTPVQVGAPSEGSPIVWLLRTLAWSVGLPFFAVSTTGPLLQKWFSRSGHSAGKDPYFLYAASNAGSVLGLVLYPFLIEPSLSRLEQARLWAFGFWGLAPLVVVCGVMAARRAKSVAEEVSAAPSRALTWARRVKWVVLAAVPSSLMIGATQYASTDIAAVPLLWMLPLVIYLGSFILAFSNRVAVASSAWGTAVAVLATVCAGLMVSHARSPAGGILGCHLALLAAAAMMCHRRLFEDRPETGRLTEFYLWMSVGGVVGGVFNALLAPTVFNSLIEYPIAIAAACLLRPTPTTAMAIGAKTSQIAAVRQIMWIAAGAAAVVLTGWAGWQLRVRLSPSDVVVARLLSAGLPVAVCGGLLLFRNGAGWLGWRGVRFAAGILALGFLADADFRDSYSTLTRSRSFFGVLSVQQSSQREIATGRLIPRAHLLHHGTTLHGIQLLPDPSRPEVQIDRIPTTYYYPEGPVGQVIAMMRGRKQLRSMAVIGLGTGSMAAYSEPGFRMTFFEIDPEVVRIATDERYFTFLTKSAKGTQIIGGDGRLSIGAQPDGAFDVIVVDAFSSDAIPIHLLTEEAIRVYMQKLAPGGVLAFHVSNRHFQLIPLLAAQGKSLGLVTRACLYRPEDTLIDRFAVERSDWFVFARGEADFGVLATKESWFEPKVPANFKPWTDDYSNILSVIQY